MSDSTASCSITVISSSRRLSQDVVTRIRELSGDSVTQPDASESNRIAWSIRNKYYTASVHFVLAQLDSLNETELSDAPAIIYTWDVGEPYRTHVAEIMDRLDGSSPEVLLAIGPSSPQDELDDFFSEHGFEYVDIKEHQRHVSEDDSDALSTNPGLSRAVDALSTIMWPSMTRVQPNLPKLSTSRTNETEQHMRALTASGEGGKSRIQREMEALEKWLEEDLEVSSSLEETESLGDPWSLSSKQSRPSARGSASAPEGFEDDFSDFVSAPPEGGPPDDNDGTGSDTEMPSRSEIRSTSERIFGGTPSHLSPSRSVPPEELEPNEDDFEPGFDFTRVLSALQGMKEEIAGIADERERRKAAAKVALGLVYGLEGTSDEIDFDTT